MRKRLPADSKLNPTQVLPLEQLESRVLLSSLGTVMGSGSVATVRTNLTSSTANSNLSDYKNGPMSNTASSLIDLYLNYRRFKNSGGKDALFNPTGELKTGLVTKSKFVGVTVHGRGTLTSLTKQIRAAGGQVVFRSGKYNAIDAVIPISQLHDLATNSGIASISPVLPATYFQQQGSSNNQAVEALNADKIDTRYGLDGTGVKVGVLSNSVDQALGGIAASQATHDLPEGGVQVIDDEFPNATPIPFTGADDEGRAMLELIHDIAPGASLAFATAGFSQLQMAENIRKLHASGAQVIVDDIGFPTEPFFQPGVIDQAIHDHVASGGVYLSSAGNNAQAGYEAPTNFVTVGSTKFVDFDPGPGVQTRLRVSFPSFVSPPGFPNFPSFLPIVLQWDNPYNGVTGSATSDLDIYAFDPRYPKKVLGSATANNIKTGIPLETIVVPAHTIDIEIRLADNLSGRPLPTRFKFVANAGGTTIVTPFPENERSVFGHNGGPDTISVGAVPFSGAPPATAANTTIASEDFSSVGPVTQLFDSAGNRLNEPRTLLKPDISGIDGTNTSFFTGVGFTSLPLQADDPNDLDSLPNFFGTSAASPNVGAVVALIKQAAPDASQEEILSALQATARSTNGAPTGTWDPKGGFGLVDGVAAAEQFVTHPTVTIQQIAGPRTTTIDKIKIVFSQQVTGFDVSDLFLQVDGGPNLLTGGNGVATGDGGRTYYLTNLTNLTGDTGTYTLTFDDIAPTITNAAGLNFEGSVDPITMSWTRLAPSPRPKAPSALSAQAISDTEIRLKWSDNEASEQGYLIQRAEDQGFTVHLKQFTVGTNVNTYNDTSLPATGRKYFYRVRAFNSLAAQPISGWSNIATATALSPGEVILDNDSKGGVIVTGDWTTTSEVPGFYGASYLEDNNTGKGSKSVKYTPNIELGGDYYVYIRWTRATDRATNVPVDITDGDGDVTTVTVNERNSGGSGWVLLGKFNLSQGRFGSVTIRNNGTNGKVIADAVRFMSATALPPVPPTSST